MSSGVSVLSSLVLTLIGVKVQLVKNVFGIFYKCFSILAGEGFQST